MHDHAQTQINVKKKKVKRKPFKLTIKGYLLLAQARVQRELGAQRVSFLSPAARVLERAQWHMAVLNVSYLLYLQALVLERKLVLILGGEEALSTQRGLYVAVFALRSQGR